MTAPIIPAHPGARTATVTAPSAAMPPSRPRVGDPSSGSGRTLEAELLLDFMEARLRDLWQDHRWFQRHPGWIHQSEIENRAELRFVLRFLREARKAAAAYPDPIDEYRRTW